MNTLLKKIFLLLLPFLLLAGYTEYRLSRMPNSFSLKKSAVAKMAPSTKILILGSSHALFGIDPGELSLPAFNLANVSQSLYYDSRLLDQFLHKQPHLQAVVVDISYFSIDFSMALTREDWRRYFYSRYFGIPPEGQDDAPWWREDFDIRRYSLIGLYGVERSFKFLRHNFEDRELDTLQPSGWEIGPAGRHSPLDDQAGKERVRLHETMMDPALESLNFSYLRRMEEATTAAGGTLLLVTTPVYPSYAAHMDRQHYQQMREQLRNFCAENGCHILDYLNDPRFTADDFFDTDHLNVNGARKLSRILDQDMRPFLPAAVPADASRLARQAQ